MADLSINKSDVAGSHEAVSQNQIINGNFETIPTFVAAQNASNWIDGTAAGSATNDVSFWAVVRNATTIAVQFDTTTFNSGTASLKISTSDATGRGIVRSVVSNWTAMVVALR